MHFALIVIYSILSLYISLHVIILINYNECRPLMRDCVMPRFITIHTFILCSLYRFYIFCQELKLFNPLGLRIKNHFNPSKLENLYVLSMHLYDGCEYCNMICIHDYNLLLLLSVLCCIRIFYCFCKLQYFFRWVWLCLFRRKHTDT